MPLLMSFLPLASLRWAGYGILAGVFVALISWATFTPSGRVTSAVAAEHEKGHVAQLEAALRASDAVQRATLEALETASRRAVDRAGENSRLSAALSLREQENAELRQRAPSPDAVVFDTDDDWLRRTPKGPAIGVGAARR